jgi:hypothetical protein
VNRRTLLNKHKQLASHLEKLNFQVSFTSSSS